VPPKASSGDQQVTAVKKKPSSYHRDLLVALVSAGLPEVREGFKQPTMRGDTVKVA